MDPAEMAIASATVIVVVAQIGILLGLPEEFIESGMELSDQLAADLIAKGQA